MAALLAAVLAPAGCGDDDGAPESATTQADSTRPAERSAAGGRRPSALERRCGQAAARRRYFIRITELSQFSATNRRLLSIGSGTLQAVHLYARGVANRDLRAAAITLAREFERLQ